MVKLTEKLVKTRAKADSLDSVKNINFWGSELTDVSILEQMCNVEVVNASVNNIDTLEPFSCCHNLKELYLRRNNIKDMKEILHLKDLNQLRLLWLSDNPCSEKQDREKYRLTVLKALPQLKTLDNISVTPEETERAKVEGEEMELPHKSNFPDNLSSETALSQINHDESNTPVEKEDSDTTAPQFSVSFQPTQLSSGEPSSQSLTNRSINSTSDSITEVAATIQQPKSNEIHKSTASNNNILKASLALVQELDQGDLKTLRMAINKRLKELNLSQEAAGNLEYFQSTKEEENDVEEKVESETTSLMNGKTEENDKEIETT